MQIPTLWSRVNHWNKILIIICQISENIWIIETISYLSQIAIDAIVNSVWFLCSFWENKSSTLSSNKIYDFKFWKKCLICFHFAGYPQKLQTLMKESFQVRLLLVCLRHFAWMITLYRYLFHGLSILKQIIFCSFTFDIFHVRSEKETISYHYFQECLCRSFISKCNEHCMKWRWKFDFLYYKYRNNQVSKRCASVVCKL